MKFEVALEAGLCWLFCPLPPNEHQMLFVRLVTTGGACVCAGRATVCLKALSGSECYIDIR